jgi:hypothetical protein
LSPSHRSAACTIAASVARLEPFAVTEPAPPLQRRSSSRSAISSPGGRCAQNPCRRPRLVRRAPLPPHVINRGLHRKTDPMAE